MKLSPQKKRLSPNYPCTHSFFSCNREFLQILASLGITAGAAIAGPATATIPPKIEKLATIKIPFGKLGATVTALCEKLGNDDFKVRKAATLKLIQIGKGQFSAKKEAESAKEIVLQAVEELSKNDDPEVRGRAKKVSAALVPKKTVPPPRVPVKGKVRIRGF